VGSVVNSTKVPLDRLDIAIDRAAAARLGIVPQDVAQAVRIAVQGNDAADSVVDGKVVHIYLRYRDGGLRTPRDLDGVLVSGAGGVLVPLSQIARVVPSTAYSVVEHQFGSRALTLTINLDGNPVSVLSRLDKAIGALQLPRDVHVVYTGEYKEMLETARQLVFILAASALLVFGIMVVQFGNLFDPAVILFKLPIDVMGAALILFVTRQPLDLTVMIGLVTLIGVSVNNGIVLLSFAQRLRGSGYDAADAMREAVAVRMRPMLLTHLTSLLGMVPAAIGIGHGPQLLQPLAIMLFGGLSMGAFLTLNLIPVLYVAADRFRRP
jgi:HAE1 family hydrophobic/amphiphilic exporter-1